MDPISSPHNDRVKLVRALQSQSKTRRGERRLVLEGVRLVRDAFTNGARPDFVLYAAAAATAAETPPDPSADPLASLLADLQAAGVGCWPVIETLMQAMADTETPQGIVGVFPWPDLLIPPQPALVIVADGWRDPGNLGTLIRTSAAAGVDLVALTPGTVDPTNPKALRGGMGAQFRVPVAAYDWDGLAHLLAGLAVYVADAGSAQSYLAVDWSLPSAIVIGGEAHGPHDRMRALPHTPVCIPMVSGAESLNAAVAASILIYAARAHCWA